MVLTKKTWFGNHKAYGVRVNGIDVRVRRAVVSDAGFANTFEVQHTNGKPPLVQDQMASSGQLALVHKKERPGPLLQSSTAFFYLMVGLDGSDKDLELKGQNIWHLAGWNHDENLNHLMEEEGVATKDCPIVFLSTGSAKDPDYPRRHPGKATVSLIAWTKPEWFSAWKDTVRGHRGPEYDEMKQTMTAHLLEVLYQHFPKTKGKVQFAELGTPLSANKYLGRSGNGEIYNLNHTVSRFDSLGAQLALHPQTTIKGLFLTGQDTVAVSIEGATMSGLLAASRVSLFALVFVCLPASVGLVFWIL